MAACCVLGVAHVNRAEALLLDPQRWRFTRGKAHNGDLETPGFVFLSAGNITISVRRGDRGLQRPRDAHFPTPVPLGAHARVEGPFIVSLIALTVAQLSRLRFAHCTN